MAGNVYTWSTTAASNQTADSDINWVEGQLPGTVNGSARGMMAAEAGLLKDNNGTLTTGGSANAHTVTSNIPIAALASGLKLRLKAGFTNTGAATLNVTPSGGAAFGVKAIKVYTASGEGDPAAGNIKVGGHYIVQYDAAANAAAGAWMLLNPSQAAATVQTFTAGGTYTPTTGAVYCAVMAKGGGGGGGSGNVIGSVFGGGGGEGAESWKLTTAAALSGQTVTVGAGGAAQAANTNLTGGTGGTSSIGSIITAPGGIGGGSVAGGSIPGAGGAGGTYDYGMPGACGTPGADSSGGGTVGLWGGGGGKGGGIAAVAGVANSGGGGGGGSSGSQSGAGGSGIVVVIEYY